MSSFAVTTKAVGHFIEQPAIIEKAEKWAGAAALGASGLILGSDVFKAEEGEKGKAAARTGIVLAATLAGTFLAWKGAAKYLEPAIEKVIGKISGQVAEDEAVVLKNHIADFVKEGKYLNLHGLMEKETKTVQEFKDLINGMAAEVKAKFTGDKAEEVLAEDLQKVLPVALDSFWESVGKMVNFFSVGGVSVLSGLAGGIAANKIIGDRDNTVDMVKEGIFQFIANIALCAVGASIGISAVNLKPVAKKLESMGVAGKAARTGIIGAGLSLGILGGGYIANVIGQKVVNPFFDKMQGKAPSQGEKRHVEFWDAILHLDDVPTALALAGVKILEPFIPLFFGFSGYRTGLGYRNGGHTPPDSKAVNQFAGARIGQGRSSMMAKNHVFQGIYNQRNATAASAALR